MNSPEALTNSGVRPLEIRYNRIISTEFLKPFAYRSELRVNSLDMGVLSPEQYAPVAERNDLCIELCTVTIEAVVRDIAELIRRNTDFGWISVAVPLKMLKRISVAAKVKKLFEQYELTDYTKLCLEFPQGLLYEDRATVNKALTPLFDMGVRLMLCDFGDEFCPSLRLKGLKVNMVMLDRYIAGFINEKGDIAIPQSITDFCRELSCEIIASGIDRESQITEAYNLNIIGVVGKVSGADIKLSTLIKSN